MKYKLFQLLGFHEFTHPCFFIGMGAEFPSSGLPATEKSDHCFLIPSQRP